MEIVRCLVALLVVSTMGTGAAAQLTTTFYNESCPQIFSIVKAEIQKAVLANARDAASLIRLHFHDCFVQGCDGSLLLDNSSTFTSEKYAAANNNSARGFEVIDAIKVALEAACPQTVSCADILALASRDSAVVTGLAPEYEVSFGRRDCLTPASIAEVNRRLPSPNMTYLELVANFDAVQLDETDLIALSGGHTIGRVRCSIVTNLLPFNDVNDDFRNNLTTACANASETFVQNLDKTTPDQFDNSYYNNLLRKEGIIPSDQTLQSTPGNNQVIVALYAQNQTEFFNQFALSTIKMGNLSPLTGDQGEIRTNCRVVNPTPSIAYE